MMQPPATRAQDFQFDTGSYATSTAATPSQPQSGCDPELSEILNTVIDIVPEYQGNLLGTIMSEPSANVATPIQPQNHQDINEKMAINAITKSLMQFENTTVFNNSPPAYSMHNVNSQSGPQVDIACRLYDMSIAIIALNDLFIIHYLFHFNLCRTFHLHLCIVNDRYV